MPTHFITGAEIPPAPLVDRAIELKADPELAATVLEHKAVALIFEKPSTRTRVSFEVGIFELGGHALILRPDEMQITRGEAIRDVAQVLSRNVAVIGYRTGSDEALDELARHASVPVINMLSPSHHPCQALADLMTLREGGASSLAYVGDGNNVARSLAIVGTAAGIDVRIASPAGYELPEDYGARLFEDPAEAVARAEAVYADVWVSMSDDESTRAERVRALEPYRLDDALLDAAAPGAFAMHCLPAHPGEEITADVLYGERQRIWDQAENRRHVQKALLEHLVG